MWDTGTTNEYIYKPQTTQKNAENICLKKISASSASSAVKIKTGNEPKNNYKPQKSQKNAENICLKKISASSASSAVKIKKSG